MKYHYLPCLVITNLFENLWTTVAKEKKKGGLEEWEEAKKDDGYSEDDD